MTGDRAERNTEPTIRLADSEDLPQVMNVLDGSLLDVAAERVRKRIEAGSVLVASERDSILAALVRSETEIETIAVRRRYRNRGIASALVERARGETDGVLIAEFDSRVRAFYESLSFEIDPTDDGRLRGHDSR